MFGPTLAERAAMLSLFLALALGMPTSTATVDLNHAPIAELVTLPGIGPKRAEQIIQLRTKRPLRRLSDLLQVKGIGPKTLQKLKPRIKLTTLPGAQSSPPPPRSNHRHKKPCFER